MGRLEVLNNVDHHDLRIRLGHGAEWGDAVNLVLVFPTEFEELQREYPLLVRRDPGGGWHTAAMLGFERDENLFLADGGWDARYVPAARRLAPFKLAFPDTPATQQTPDPIVQVDMDDPRVSRSEGAPVFLPAGGQAPYLDHVIKILRAVHVGLEIGPPMFAAFEAHGLIEPARLEITLDDGSRLDVPDVFTIGREPLARLGPEALAELHRAGFLRLAFMLSASLANVPHLIDRKARARRAAGPRPPASRP